jgi:outer membrane lipoprotein carrier protein
MGVNQGKSWPEKRMRPYNMHKDKALRTGIRICLIALVLIGCCLIAFGRLGGIIFPSAWAKTESHPEVLDGFKKWYGEVTSFHADFHQTTLNPLWGEEEKAGGEVWFKKPGLMHWKYVFPQKDTIVINPEGFFWYVPEDKQVIKKEPGEAFRIISPMSILGDNMQLEKDFEIMGIEAILSKDSKETLGYAISLIPRNPDMAVKRISVEVRAEQFSLAAIEVEESSGNRNRIEFKEIEMNREADPGLFRFSPPPGTKVITPKDFPAW